MGINAIGTIEILGTAMADGIPLISKSLSRAALVGAAFTPTIGEATRLKDLQKLTFQNVF